MLSIYYVPRNTIVNKTVWWERQTLGVGWDEPGAREPKEPGGRREILEGFLEEGKS